MKAKFWAILPAAGSGNRFASNVAKQYMTILDKTVMQHSVDRMCQLPIEGCVVAISPNDSLARSFSFAKPALLHFVLGGAERMDSVLAALEYLQPIAADNDWILVHDVARPCILPSDLEHLIEELQHSEVGGLLAIPVRDTLKRGLNERVVETVPREQLWQCQTPQMFRFSILLKALQQARQQHNQHLITDEASAVEQLGLPVQLINGSSTNIKITYAEDLGLATAIIKAQRDDALYA